MTAFAWERAAKGSSVSVDWSQLNAASCFDAYLCWHDFTGSQWAGSSIKQTRVILELKKALDKKGFEYLKRLGVRVLRHFARPGPWVRVTAVCMEPSDLRALADACLSGKDPLLERYELSEGFVQPDAIVAQQWEDFALQVQSLPPKATLVGFIDHGCAFANRQFTTDNGASRVAVLWNQQEERRPARHPAPPARLRARWRRQW
jgi:hypothetical protein